MTDSEYICNYAGSTSSRLQLLVALLLLKFRSQAFPSGGPRA